MAKTIKSFAVSATSSITVYTVPASTTAKVLISSFSIVATGSSAAKLSVGHRSFEAKAALSSALSFNPSVSVTSSTEATSAAPMELFLTAGQTISTTIDSPEASVTAQIVVIEEDSP